MNLSVMTSTGFEPVLDTESHISVLLNIVMGRQLPTWIIKDTVSQLRDKLAKSEIGLQDFATSTYLLDIIENAADALRETLSKYEDKSSSTNC